MGLRPVEAVDGPHPGSEEGLARGIAWLASAQSCGLSLGWPGIGSWLLPYLFLL